MSKSWMPHFNVMLWILILILMCSQALYRLKCEYKVKTVEEQGVRACSLARNTLKVKGRAGALRWD
jgi:hypothetical protein